MPTVPISQRQTAPEMAPVNNVNLRLPQQGLGEQLAQTGNSYIQAIGQEKEKQDLAFAQDRLVKFQTDADDLINNPQTGLITKQGANAIGQGDEVARKLSAMATDAFNSLPNGPVKDQFRNQFEIAGKPLAKRARQYEVGQRQQFEVGQQQGMLTNQVRQARDNYDNHEIVESSLSLGGQQIVSYGRAHGQSDEEIESNWNDYRESLGRGVLHARVASGKFQQYIDRNGEPSDRGGVPRFSAHGNSSAARGLRNNNPGNIEASKENPWEGQTGSDGRFATFETPEHGIRALGKNLLSYNRLHGLDTVGGIITRWAPPKENETDAYIKAICARLGVGANDQIDVTNPRTLAELCAGIIRQENGKEGASNISADQINNGVSAALGIIALPSSKRRTGDLAFDMSSPADQASYLGQMQSMRNQYQSEYRVGLELRVKDAEAAYLMGKEAPNPPKLGEFITAYGERNGPMAYEQFRDTQQLGSDIAAVQKLSFTAQQDLLTMREPVPGDGFDAASKRQRILAQAVNTVNKARMADPIQYATDLRQVDPVNIGNPASLKKDFVSRASSAAQVSRQFGTPLTIFSKQEAAQLGDMLVNDPSTQAVAYLDLMRQGLGTGAEYSAAMQQISNYAPSAAVAGAIMGKSSNVVAKSGWGWGLVSDTMVSPDQAAKTIIEGANARKGIKSNINGFVNETKGILLPKDTDLRPDFDKKVGSAFAGDAIGAAQAYEVAKDYYAGLMVRKGTFSGDYDSNAWKQAINAATGGVYDYNGQGDVLLPWGMSESQFDSEVDRAWKNQVVDAGIKAPPGQYGLQSYGDSQYLIKLGGGYLIGNDGNPVVLRLNADRVRLGKGGIPE
ncbi:hypothetical protein FHU10_0599 [Serratia fonticola]|uniref:Uncharacterized protein n=1 Tax=Serratia fonticola TaxID=47917 RepID=A0A542D6F9_SERFO|nr:hypothetical protein [Serratia fonticola]TQI79327.1 hypothetical protein FHU09_1850 [Serratia fonticola]TQI98648.1 hypothetical protein FHU11_4198 [Serratia fonticola]TVZ68175.1 hypothetical protein FHU10_0599 [Serratia fonticola]